MLGIVMVIALVGVSAGDDCGCGAFDPSPPDAGWSDRGDHEDFGGLNSHDSSNGGSSSGSGSAGPSDPGSSSSGSSSSGSGSQTSGSSASGDSGSGGASSGGVSSDAAVLLASKGLDLYKKGDFNDSLIALNASLDNDPYIPKTWMTKGDVLASMGRYEEAITAYSKVIKLDPSDPTAYAKTGDALVNAGKFTEAVASYDHALAANPGLTAVQTNRTRAVGLASGLMKGNLTTTEPTVEAVAPVLPLETNATTSPAMTVPSTASTTKAPLSLLVLLMVVPITGIVSFILNRKKI